MLDNVGLKLESVSMDDFNKIISTLEIERPIDSSKMKAKWENMQLLYFPNSNELVLQNSLHKLYNKIVWGNNTNANDFHLADLHILSTFLSESCFERPIEDFKLTRRFEFGFNISTDSFRAIDIVHMWHSLKMNPFYTVPPLKKGQKPLQRTCYFCDYKVKVYDKAKQEGITTLSTKNILRYEIAVDQPRKWEKILDIKGASLKDVNEHESWVKLHDYLLETYDSITKIPLVETFIPIEDIYVSYSYTDSLMANVIRNNLNKSSFKRKRAEAKILYNRYNRDGSNIHNLIRTKIQSKFLDLCN